MRHKLSRPSAHRLVFTLVPVALLAATAGLLCACGGADDGQTHSVAAAVDRAPTPDDSAAEAVVLDLDALGSIEAAMEHAARAHGAPGEDERMRYMVRAASRTGGEQLAAALTARGFAPVFQTSEAQR